MAASRGTDLPLTPVEDLLLTASVVLHEIDAFNVKWDYPSGTKLVRATSRAHLFVCIDRFGLVVQETYGDQTTSMDYLFPESWVAVETGQTPVELAYPAEIRLLVIH